MTTGTGTYVDTSDATLTGNLTGLSPYSSAIVYIDWGTTTSYGNTISIGTLSSLGAFSGTATGLSEGATYHFQARAIGNATGGTTVLGSDVTYVHSNTTPCGNCAIGSTTGDIYGQAFTGAYGFIPVLQLPLPLSNNISLKAMWAGNVKVAIYDNSGNLLNANNAWQPMVAGCNSA